MTLPPPYYEDDFVTLYHGDCLELLPFISADVLVTDPPYGIAWKQGHNKVSGIRAHAGIRNDETTAARDSMIAACGEIPGVVFGSFYAPFPSPLKQVLVWRKPPDAGIIGSVTGYRRDAEPVFLVGEWPQRVGLLSSVLDPGARGISATAAATGHPHTKPVPLLRALIESAPPGTILDPFAGSGSTLVAAKDLGRKSIGIEIEEKYCEIAANRCAQEVMDFGAAA